MITEHKKLLEQIQSAETLAREIYEDARGIEPVVTKLRDAGKEVRARIGLYQAEDERKKREAAAAKAPAPAPAPAKKPETTSAKAGG